jgi:hypothetical protein
MSNKDARPVEDHHIANLDRHAKKIVDQLRANEWKLLANPEMEVYEMKELLQEQSELEKVINWLASIKSGLRPPQILAPNGATGMKLVN